MVWKDAGVGGAIEAAGSHSGSVPQHKRAEYAGKRVQGVGGEGV